LSVDVRARTTHVLVSPALYRNRLSKAASAGLNHSRRGRWRFQRIKAFSAAAKRVAQRGRQQHDDAL
jgi:hypothetical protein